MNNILWSLILLVMGMALAPLQRGVINRVKARMAGRTGAPLLQPYFDLYKLLWKGSVYSETTTMIFRAGPVIGLATALGALFLLPFGGQASLIHFNGDIILFVYFLGLGRFFTILAALDTGSSFEGMGASREAFFSALAEPALLIGMGALVCCTGGLSLSQVYNQLADMELTGFWGPSILLTAASFILVYLTENSRIPVDDPTTHLELTMIHEVMILDHSGVDLALIEYAGSLRLWLFGSLIIGTLFPPLFSYTIINATIAISGIMALSMFVGILESTMARLRMLHVPRLLTVSIVFSLLAMLWSLTHDTNGPSNPLVRNFHQPPSPILKNVNAAVRNTSSSNDENIPTNQLIKEKRLP